MKGHMAARFRAIHSLQCSLIPVKWLRTCASVDQGAAHHSALAALWLSSFCALQYLAVFFPSPRHSLLRSVAMVNVRKASRNWFLKNSNHDSPSVWWPVCMSSGFFGSTQRTWSFPLFHLVAVIYSQQLIILWVSLSAELKMYVHVRSQDRWYLFRWSFSCCLSLDLRSIVIQTFVSGNRQISNWKVRWQNPVVIFQNKKRALFIFCSQFSICFLLRVMPMFWQGDCVRSVQHYARTWVPEMKMPKGQNESVMKWLKIY